MRFEQIRCQQDHHVLTITLNRPQRLNAWTERMGREIAAAFDRADADDDVRAIIVTGEGRASCAGMDLDARRRWVDYAKDDRFGYTDIDESAWYVVAADDKRTLRLTS